MTAKRNGCASAGRQAPAAAAPAANAFGTAGNALSAANPWTAPAGEADDCPDQAPACMHSLLVWSTYGICTTEVLQFAVPSQGAETMLTPGLKAVSLTAACTHASI